MKIFQQAGHNTVWNLQSLQEDGAGDGIIFSPVHFAQQRMEREATAAIKQVSLFDPQFYVPDSQKSRLHSYAFFPEKLMNGFSTADFEKMAYEAADLCLQFQEENGFEGLIIPARYFADLVTDFIPQQKHAFVEPFLHSFTRRRIRKPLFLTLPLTAAMLLDKEYRDAILDWVTSYPEITGVYLLVHYGEATKQLQHFDKMRAHVEFIRDLQGADLEVICGYCNTEGILFSALDVHGITMGAYENTRGFSIDKFLEDDQDRRGPAPRIFLPNLLNWVRWTTAEEIRQDFPELWERIYTPTDYSEAVFASGQPPHFTQPNLYKHHFVLKAELYRELRGVPVPEREKRLAEKIRKASELYREIAASGVLFFDANCSGEHLPVWNRILRHLPSCA